MDSEDTWGFHVKDGLLSVICGDGNCSRRATVRLGINTLIANVLVYYFFRTLIFKAKERHPVGSLPGSWNVLQFYNAAQRGHICVPYILRSESLQIVGRFFADFGVFKPYNFGIAQGIANRAGLTMVPNVTWHRVPRHRGLPRHQENFF